jgi:transaldolase
MNEPATSTGLAGDNNLLLFLDSADTSEWDKWLPLGNFQGVTTNPLLLERAGQACSVANLKRLTQAASGLGAREIQLQTWGETADEMIGTGRELAALAVPGLETVIKIPATAEGFVVARALKEAGCRTTITAVYTCGQVMFAAGLGADYAAPYVGRLDDAGLDGIARVNTMHKILRETGKDTRLLTASLRTAAVVIDLASAGLDTFTFGPAVAEELLTSKLTTTAAADFQRAAKTMGEY